MFFIDFIRLMWRHSKRQTLSFFGLSIISSLTEGIGLFLLVPILGTLQTTTDQTGLSARSIEFLGGLGLPVSLTGLLLLFLGLVLLRCVVQYLHSTVTAKLQFDLINGLRTRSFAAVLSANWQWSSTLTRSDHSNSLTTEMQRIASGLTTAITLPTTVFLIAAYLIAAFNLSFVLTCLALCVGAVLTFAMRSQHVQAFALGKTLTTAQRTMQRTIQEGFAAVKQTKILGNEERHTEKLTGILNTVRDQQMAFVRTNSQAAAVFQLGVAVFLAIVILLGRRVFNVSFEELMILVLILVRLAPMLRRVQQSVNRLLHSWPALSAFETLEADAKTHGERYKPIESSHTLLLDQHIQLSDVSFKYLTRETASLNGISATIAAKKTTAIVGPSGAGKSTLSDILMGLLTPTTGTMSVDGQMITAENQVLWRNSVAYVPQDIFLFNDTVRNNLLWVKPDATEDQIEQSLTRSAATFVFDLPDGLDTVVGDSGLMLSGGERQRLALAGALLLDPQLLILDEATSALDAENELHIRNTIDALAGTRTVIVIGHRPLTLQAADDVIVLKDGTVAAQGTWDAVKDHLNSH